MKTIDEAIAAVRAFDPDAAASIESHLSMWRWRAGAWQDREGTWVSSRDIVEMSGDGFFLLYEVDEIEIEHRKYCRLFCRDFERKDKFPPHGIFPTAPTLKEA